jgi:predicted ribosome quality control (RQC) complex YloA/Tae2 family protein
MKTEVVYLENIDTEVTYLIGKNSADNFKVIDMSDQNDIWFHSKDESSCHVVAKITEDFTKKELLTIYKRGALLCKENTFKLKSLSNVPIIYTEIKNIEKTNQIGAVLTKNTKTILV